jgi:hypothetical protein
LEGAPEPDVGPERRAGKWGLVDANGAERRGAHGLREVFPPVKIKQEDYDDLVALLGLLKDIPEQRVLYKAGKFPHAERVRDLPKRFAWDMFFRTPEEPRLELTWRLYKYLHDEHIYTALRRIVPLYE